ncbi:MAG TPA: O-antigen ligase family protein [Terriglobia bacterium]|nr:O-antigen ligase family protein [Terriglobia bacterium]
MKPLLIAEAATLLFIFVLYLNLPLVAMEFHGVPWLLAASAPVLLVLPLGDRLIRLREKIIIDQTLVLMLLWYLPALIASTIFVKDTGIALNEIGNFLVEGMVLYLLVINVIRTLPTLKRSIWVLLLAGGLLGGLSVYQEMTQSYENSYGGLAQRSTELNMNDVDFDVYSGSRRAGGPLGTENRYAQILIVLLPLALGLFYAEWSWKAKFSAAVAGAFILGGIVLTFSRGAFLTLVGLLLIITLLRYVRPYQLIGAAVFVSVLICASLPEYVVRMSSLAGLSSFLSTKDNDVRDVDGALRGRFAENVAALRVFGEHPVLGVGPGQFPRFYSARYGTEVGTKRLWTNRRGHNLYLEMAAETGIVGIAAFMTMVLATLYRLWQERQYWSQTRPELSHMATAFLLSIMGYLGTAAFLHLSYQRYYWFLLALAGAAIQVLRTESLQNEFSEQPTVQQTTLLPQMSSS